MKTLRLISLFFVLIYPLFILAQAIDSWQAFPSLHNATWIEPAQNKIFVLANSNLYSYNVDDSEIYVFDKTNGLSGSKISFIRYVESTAKLVAVYEDGNVDIIYTDNDVFNMNQISQKNYTNLTINNVIVNNEFVYICTNFGYVVLNTESEVFEATYNIELNTLSLVSINNIIYLSTDDAFYAGSQDLNLLDRTQWQRVGTNSFSELISFDNALIGFNKSTGITQLSTTDFSSQSLLTDTLTFFSVSNNVMVAGNAARVYVFSSLSNVQTISIENAFQILVHKGNYYWAAQANNGLQQYSLSDNKLSPINSAIIPNSPKRDYFCNMHYTSDGTRLLVAGGDLNYNSIIREGTLMFFENNSWTNFNEENITEQTGQPYINLTAIAQDPNDPAHHFASSARHGLYEYRDQTFVKKYGLADSPLTSILPENSNAANYVGVDALQYDSNGNLWMANLQVDTILNILKKDGTWLKLYYEEISEAPNITHIYFDNVGRMWMNSKRLDWNGIFVLDTNGTLEDTSDDTHLLRQNIINQDGTEYSPYYINCFVQDLNNQIWVGTSDGLFVIEDPDDFIYNSDFRFTQIKITREDESGYADYLFNGVDISAITVDGANRKWIGTSSDGIYLVSEDGQETLLHYTTENAPLPSDEIVSIAINPLNGQVMIGTYLGLIAYTSDALTAANTLEKNNVRVYPNPVRPDWTGLITIDGLTYNAEVKITTATGQLIACGRSLGGRFTWDGKNIQGKRVSSGVYNIISTNQEGKKAIVNRIVIVH